MLHLPNFEEERLPILIGAERVPSNSSWVREKYSDQAEAMISEAKAYQHDQNRLVNIQTEIGKRVASQKSLLGTTADAAQLSVAVHMALISAIEANTTFGNFKIQFLGTLTALVGNDRETGKPVDVPAMADGFLGKLQTGEVILTAAVKGVPAVIDEIGARSTGVAKILIAASQHSNSNS